MSILGLLVFRMLKYLITCYQVIFRCFSCICIHVLRFCLFLLGSPFEVLFWRSVWGGSQVTLRSCFDSTKVILLLCFLSGCFLGGFLNCQWRNAHVLEGKTLFGMDMCLFFVLLRV